MNSHLRNVMMLLTDGFGGFGGIAQFNRDFLRALDRSEIVCRTLAFPRLVRSAISEEIPESVVYLEAAANKKLGFAYQVLRGLYLSSDIDLVICGHVNLLPLAAFVAAKKRARLALVIHGIEVWKPISGFRARALEALDAVIAVSQFTAERFRCWANVSADRIAVLGNCVDLNRFVPQSSAPALLERYDLRDHRVIMTLGRLSKVERYKGVDEVLDILPVLICSIPNLKYLIVGDGDDRNRLEEKARSLDLKQHVVFAGRISEAEKVAHYNLADAFVMPSSGEGFGIVLLEAAACGVRVIGSAIDGAREALVDGDLGDLVDPRRPADLRQAILTVLQTQSAKQRPKGIETFGVSDFELKVNRWLLSQVSQAISSAA